MASEDENVDLIIKIVIIGDTAVGKTNLILRYLRDQYDSDNKATIGVDFFVKDMETDGHKFKIQFFDTAGQEKYKSICSTYYKNADGVILAYDVVNRRSFDNIESWLDEIHRYQTKDTKVLLVGNKIDLDAKRQVTTDEGQTFAKEKKLYFMETSALTNKDKCVNKSFEVIINEIMSIMLQKRDEAEKLEYEQIKRKSLVFNIKNSQVDTTEGNNTGKSCAC